MKSFINEFKEFALKGNVMDMAVGIIIGAAFTAIVTSLVNDILSPFLGLIGGIDCSAAVLMIGDVAIKWGSFVMAVINFLLVALCLFVVIKAINKAGQLGKKQQEEESAPETKTCPFCKSEISVEATRCPHCTSVLEE